MDDYVGKPLDRAELAAALERGAARLVDSLNIEVLDRLKGDDEDLLVTLIELFAATAPADMLNLRRALAHPTPASLSMAAHTLKGSCSNFGAEPLSNLCRQIDDAALNPNLEGAADLIAQAEDELSRLLEALTSYRKVSLST